MAAAVARVIPLRALVIATQPATIAPFAAIAASAAACAFVAIVAAIADVRKAFRAPVIAVHFAARMDFAVAAASALLISTMLAAVRLAAVDASPKAAHSCSVPTSAGIAVFRKLTKAAPISEMLFRRATP